MLMKARSSLGLARMPIPQKIEKGRHIVTEVGSSPYFPSPIPPLAEVTAAIDALEAAHNAAQGGGPALTAIMYDKEELLDSVLNRLANFVEIIADGDDAIIL